MTTTREARWLPFLTSLDLPRLDLTVPPARVVVVAPHPDDEVLAVGGLMALLVACGTVVEVVAVTDGDASHPGGSIPSPELARLRIAESEAALDVLGVPPRITRLGLPDGAAEGLEDPVCDALTGDADTWVVAPWAHDGHPDHEAVARACVRAARRDGARLLSYPVWTWHWAPPGEASVPWASAVRVPLPDDLVGAKASAIAAFVTQITPIGPLPADAAILPPDLLAPFGRSFELLFDEGVPDPA